MSQVNGTVLQAEETVTNQVRVIRKEMIDQQTTIAEQLTSARNNQQKQEQQYREDFSGLSESILQLGKDLGRTAVSWNLEEAEQLIFIANQRLQLSGEAGLAIRALTLANSRLEVTGNPDLIEVRRLLTNEIASLEKVKQPDFIAILSAIESLSSGLEELPLAGDLETILPQKSLLESKKVASINDTQGSDEQSLVSNNTEAGADADSSDELSNPFLNNSVIQSLVTAGKVFLADLSDLIQIEKNGKAVNPIISAEVKFMTLEKARLILESAQSAFLRKQFDVYQQRMLSAVSWVESRFVDSEQRKLWLEEISALSAEVYVTELPDISKSLKAIRAIIKKG